MNLYERTEGIPVKISIIIVTHNSEKYINECIDSILAFSNSEMLEIIIVDNASTDGTTNGISRNYPTLNLIKNNHNIGFGAACNIGIKMSKSPYIFLLNPDTVLLNDVLSIFYKEMEKNQNEEIWCCGGQLYDEKLNPVKSFRQFPTIRKVFLQQSGFEYLKKKIINKYKLDNKNNIGKKIIRDFFIIGADMFIRNSVLEKIGMFNESFFMNYEESELSYRAKKNEF